MALKLARKILVNLCFISCNSLQFLEGLSSNHDFLKEKSYHLPPDIFAKLVLSLARSLMPIPSSMILRLMLEKGILPPMHVLRLMFLHMVNTEVGTCVVSNLLVQICDYYIRFCSGKSHCANLLKLDTMIFNLLLDACFRFASSLDAQQIIELMSQTGVVADAYSIIIIAQIHEMNWLRDELKKFKDHVAPLLVAFVSHYQQFYECLLSLHFKFDDINAAAELLLDMHRSRESHPVEDPGKDYQKPLFVPIGSQNLRNGLKILIVPELFQSDLRILFVTNDFVEYLTLLSPFHTMQSAGARLKYWLSKTFRKLSHWKISQSKGLFLNLTVYLHLLHSFTPNSITFSVF